MDEILLERIEKLGQMGDVVKVKPGFARNFLLPQRKALRASKGNLELFESQRKQLEADNLERRQEAEKVGERSEEHTSELQSLMRISYAVFCLKKKKKTNTKTIM